MYEIYKKRYIESKAAKPESVINTDKLNDNFNYKRIKLSNRYVSTL